MSEIGHRRGSERRPIALQIRLAFDRKDEFVERYAINISEGGIFIRSREPRPVGTRLKFELFLRTGQVVFSGEGVVRWTQPPEAGLAVAGMGLQFDQLTDESRAILKQILELREQEQVPPAVAASQPAAWRPLADFPTPVDSVPEVTPINSPVVLTSLHDVPTEPGTPFVTPGPSPDNFGRPRTPPRPSAPALTRPTPAQTPRMTPSSVTPARGLTLGGQPIARLKLAPKGVAIGLDLGWSSFRIAAAQGGRAHPITLNGKAFPAVVAATRTQWTAGPDAVTAIAQGARGFRGISSVVGRWADSPVAKVWRRRQITELVAGTDGRAALRENGQLVSAETLLTVLLRSLTDVIADKIPGVVAKAVIAVPNGWSDAQRHAVKKAAQAAGLPVEELVPASAAAALACHGARGKRRILALHFGESAFEAGIVEQKDHVYDLVGSAFEPGLGGADLDTVVVDALLGQFEKETGFQVPKDPIVFERVRSAVADAKERLSEALEYEVVVDNLAEAGLSKVDLQQKLTRARLIQLANPMIDQIVEVARSAMQARRIGTAELDEILLFGGQSRFGALIRRIADKLGREPVRPDIADDAVAIGAAMIADGASNLGGHVVVGSVGSSVSVGVFGGGVKRVVDRNLPLPAERPHTVTSTVDGQTEIQLFLFQGEKAQAFENEYLGAAVIGPLAAKPKGEVRLSVLVALDASGALSVRARDASNGRPVPVRLDRDCAPEVARRTLGIKG